MMHRPDSSQSSAFIEEAIELLGSEAKLGRASGFSQNAIWHAKRYGRISGDLACGVDRATGGKVSKNRMRPDLFDAPPSVHEQPGLQTEPAVVAAEALHGGDLTSVKIPDRSLSPCAVDDVVAPPSDQPAHST